MKQDKVSEFETTTSLEQVVAVRPVRHLDHADGRPDMETPNSGHFAPIVRQMVDRHCGRKS